MPGAAPLPKYAATLWLVLMALSASGLFSAKAQEASDPTVPALSQARLSELNAALKNLPIQLGRFEQILANGATAQGSYHMHWPDRLRFAYGSGDNGAGSIVTVRGKFVAVQETPRGEPNWFPVSLTPLAVLRAAAADGISQAMILAHQDTERYLSLSVHDPGGALPGSATLYFTKPDLRLYAWRLVDVQNLVTQVRLFPEAFPATLSERLFDIDYDDENEDE